VARGAHAALRAPQAQHPGHRGQRICGADARGGRRTVRSGPYVKAIRLFSETNPVPDMAVFEFPVPIERVEIESRIRLAGTQQVVAAAEMTDGVVYAIATEVIVTLAGCMDGT
jgi:hypothetical protein